MKQTKIATLISAISIIIISSVIIIAQQYGIKPGQLTRDVSAILNGPAYTGIFSQIGLICWSIALGLQITLAKSKELHGLIHLLSTLTLILLLDDLLQIHEFLYYRNISEFLIFSAYAILTLALCFKYYKLLFKLDYVYFILAICYFSLSVIFDLCETTTVTTFHYLFEDGFKLMGIIMWLTFSYSLTKKSFS